MTTPKAELHVHLEGTATPELVRRLAARHGVRLRGSLFDAEDRFQWRDFLHFLTVYDQAASVIRTEEGKAQLTDRGICPICRVYVGKGVASHAAVCRGRIASDL